MTDYEPDLPVRLLEPLVGTPVHYVSFGTPGGEYQSVCRAAIVTEVGQWITDSVVDVEDRLGAPRTRLLKQTFYGHAVALCVLNPTGLFFNGGADPQTVGCRHDPGRAGGTWHWPGEGGCTS